MLIYGTEHARREFQKTNADLEKIADLLRRAENNTEHKLFIRVELAWKKRRKDLVDAAVQMINERRSFLFIPDLPRFPELDELCP